VALPCQSPETLQEVEMDKPRQPHVVRTWTVERTRAGIPGLKAGKYPVPTRDFQNKPKDRPVRPKPEGK
jgi:hypothetical protein